jgi:hypothetical protein
MSLFAPTFDGRGALPFSKVCPTARKMAERPSLKKAIDVAESSGINLMKTAEVPKKIPASAPSIRWTFSLKPSLPQETTPIP